ncbi:MAG: ATP-grasp domain-containing protein [Massilimaliae sp.]|nr:ATP-grasp domain-containing protein [Massiliimalia sp.]
MKLEEREFLPVILGGDITTYSLARSFHEEYHIKSIAISMQKNWLNSYSGIIENIIVPNMHREEVFIRTLLELGKTRGKEKKLILIACGDWYVRLIIEHKKELGEYYVIPYIDEELMNRMVLKDSFYEICDQTGVPYPKTFVYDCKEKNELNLPFEFPVIAKPASSAQYHYAEFKGKKKVYKFETMDQLRAMLKELETSSYDYKFLIQDFIPGDDTYMNILTCYCDRDSKVRFMSFGRTLMEDQGPMAIGNPVAIINEVKLDVMNKAKAMLEAVGYTGFANFDIKYDMRDGSYRYFEINTRLGRSNFYVTGSGFNAVKWIVDDLIYHKKFDGEPVIADRENLYTVIPKSIIMKYVKDDKLKEQVERLYREGKVSNPIDYKGDSNLIHKLYAKYFMLKQKRRFEAYL